MPLDRGKKTSKKSPCEPIVKQGSIDTCITEQIPVVVIESVQKSSSNMNLNLSEREEKDSSEDFVTVKGSGMKISRSVSNTYLSLREDSSSEYFLSVEGDMEVEYESCSSLPHELRTTTNTDDASKEVKKSLSNIAVQTNAEEAVPQNVKKVLSDTLVQTDSEPKKAARATDASPLHKKSYSAAHELDKLKMCGITTTKRDRFLIEAMSDSSKRDKDVEEIPGIGKEYGGRLKDKGIITAKNLYGYFLINPNNFQEYLMTFGIDAWHAGLACRALTTWDKNHN